MDLDHAVLSKHQAWNPRIKLSYAGKKEKETIYLEYPFKKITQTEICQIGLIHQNKSQLKSHKHLIHAMEWVQKKKSASFPL